MRAGPGMAESLVILAAALGAGTMPRRQRGRLIEEEQLGVVARMHDLTPPPAKLQHTHDPAAHLAVTHDLAALIVQHAAIAEHQPTLGRRDEVAKRGHAVL